MSMSSSDYPTTWTHPRYIATVVGLVAFGALVFYSSLTDAGPTVDEIVFVILVLTVPATIAHELARRWQ